MFNHILVPLDGSRLAEAALSPAAFLADKLGSAVTLLHVIERNPPNRVHGQAHLSEAGEAAAYLDAVAQRAFPGGSPVRCHVHPAAVADVAASIVSHRGELNYDLIVMCSHGRGRALHLLLGTIAQQVIARGSVPVMITFPGGKAEQKGFDCRNILLPLDGDPEHEQALPAGRDLAKACDAALALVLVVPTFSTLSGQRTVSSRFWPATTSRMLEMSADSGEQYLRAQMDKLRGQGFAATGRIWRADPANGIVEAAAQTAADVIVLATHGKSGMNAFWAGSVAHKVCRQCSVPLLLIPVAASRRGRPPV